MNRLKIAQYIAAGATALSVIGFIIGFATDSEVGIYFLLAGFGGGLVSYLFGGLLTALKMAGKIAKWGWLILPFPYDIMTFLLSLIFSLLTLICFPIIPVRKAYKESEQQ